MAPARTKPKRSIQISRCGNCRGRCLNGAFDSSPPRTAATTISIFALEEIICERVESVAFYTESRQRCVRLFREAFRFRARFLQTNDGRVSRLLCGDIFARTFAEFFTGLCHIENVVDDLKRQTKRASKFCDRTELLRIRVCAHRAEPDRRSQDRGSLVFVNVTQTRHVDLLSFAFEIGDLSRDSLLTAGSDRDLA